MDMASLSTDIGRNFDTDMEQLKETMLLHSYGLGNYLLGTMNVSNLTAMIVFKGKCNY